MKRKRSHVWALFVPILLAAAAFTVCFWDAILIRIAPKAVLTSALKDVCSQLEARFQENPLLILAKFVYPEGKYTADVTLKTSNDILGQIGYDMKVHTDAEDHQLFAEGIATASEENISFALYMDANFMAVSSDDLVNGNYYGITYNTFTTDLRSIPLLNFVVSDHLLSRWDASIQEISKQMSRDYILPQIPDFSQEDLQGGLLAILALPCEVETGTVSLGGGFMNCRILSYCVEGAQVGELLTSLTGDQYAEDASATVSFYLHENSLVKIAVSGISGSCNVVYTLDLGLCPAEEILSLRRVRHNHGSYNDFVAVVETQNSQDAYTETWQIYQTKDNVSQNTTFSFDWVPSEGKMKLRFGDDTEGILMKLAETEGGFQVSADRLDKLLQIIRMDMQSSEDSVPISCSMMVTRGSEITTPEYKNLDKWSLEDFFILLSGVGSLIGINIGI